MVQKVPLLLCNVIGLTSLLDLCYAKTPAWTLRRICLGNVIILQNTTEADILIWRREQPISQLSNHVWPNLIHTLNPLIEAHSTEAVHVDKVPA